MAVPFDALVVDGIAEGMLWMLEAMNYTQNVIRHPRKVLKLSSNKHHLKALMKVNYPKAKNDDAYIGKGRARSLLNNKFFPNITPDHFMRDIHLTYDLAIRYRSGKEAQEISTNFMLN